MSYNIYNTLFLANALALISYFLLIHYFRDTNVDLQVVMKLSKIMASERLRHGGVRNLKLKLIAERNSDGRINNLPTVSEVAVLIVGDIDLTSQRDIIMETQSGQLKRINELHASYLAFQYPLLFPYGEDGYRHDVCHRDRLSSQCRKRNRVTKNEAQTLLSSRRLFHQFLVDAYTMVESERLCFIKRNQKKLRVDKYKNLNETQGSDQSQGSNRGKRVILPSTFVGGRRYMDQLYFDGMVICSSLGFPNLFLTMTCNPNWPEIFRILMSIGFKPHDRPDIISRKDMFWVKYLHVNMYIIEFQKRGLPHAHLLIFLHPSYKYPTPGLMLSDEKLQNLTLKFERLSPNAIPKGYITRQLGTRLIYDELNYDTNELKDNFNLLFQSLIGEQCKIFKTIMEAVNQEHGRMFFLYGYGGIGKTHICFKWYSFVIATRGRTTHSKFKILVPSLENSICNIHQGSELAGLLKQTKQFPIIVSYAMTINKSQGQSLESVGLYLLKPVFSHGQLYIAISRVKSKK
ncbi:hypothetical protein Lal_00026883 [Lupinus albus]|nr:hypothetical protein Lal_00026883 [Lupinus albus]